MFVFRSLILVLAALCLIGTVAIHASTFTGIDLESYVPRLRPIVFLFVGTTFAAAYVAGRGGGTSGSRRTGIVLIAALAFCFVNFAFLVRPTDGMPVDRGGGVYVLEWRGRTVRAISEPEFHAARINRVRLWAGWWVLFSAAALTIVADRLAVAPNQSPQLTDNAR